MAVSKKRVSITDRVSGLKPQTPKQYLDKIGPTGGRPQLALVTPIVGAVKPLPEPPPILTPSVSLSVNPPLPAATFSNAEYEVNADTPVTFSAAASNAGSPYYQWYRNGSPITNATSSVYITSSIADSSSFYVLITSSYSPTTTAYASSSIQVVRVPANVSASVILSASQFDITTEPTLITLTALTKGGGLSPTYIFISGSTIIQSGASNTVTYNAYVGDTYYVQFTSSFSQSVGSPTISTQITII